MRDRDVTIAICSLLGDIAGWAWRPTGPAYQASEVGVFYGAIKAAPDRAVGIRVYGGSDEVATGVAWRRVQVFCRGAKNAPDGADELAAEVFSVLHGLSRVGGMDGIRRVSMAPLGADDNGREERSDNYEVLLGRGGQS